MAVPSFTGAPLTRGAACAILSIEFASASSEHVKHRWNELQRRNDVRWRSCSVV